MKESGWAIVKQLEITNKNLQSINKTLEKLVPKTDSTNDISEPVYYKKLEPAPTIVIDGEDKTQEIKTIYYRDGLPIKTIAETYHVDESDIRDFFGKGIGFETNHPGKGDHSEKDVDLELFQKQLDDIRDLAKRVVPDEPYHQMILDDLK